ncbi:serine hydrolase [Microdochium nivale]|nr:serine hydrolase [Microdochium nivale]
MRGGGGGGSSEAEHDDHEHEHEHDESSSPDIGGGLRGLRGLLPRGRGRNPLSSKDFVELVRAGLDEWHVPGISVAVVDGVRGAGDDGLDDGGGSIWAEGFGYSKLPRRCVSLPRMPGSSKGEGGADVTEEERDVDEDGGAGVPATADTLYYAGSTTKAFTAAVLGQMIHPLGEDKEDGGSTSMAPATAASSKKYRARFPKGWRTPISTIIRNDFVLGGNEAWPTAHVTFEDALCHRTGLARHDKAMANCYPDDDNVDDDEGVQQQRRHRATVRDFTRILRHLPLVEEPRVVFRYCNLMFIAVSRAIEVIAARGEEGGSFWLGDIMREWIWKPLGMESTFLNLRDAQRARPRPGGLAEGYYWNYSPAPPQGEEMLEKKDQHGYHYVPFMDLSGGSGAGGTLSSVADYALWVRCLLAEGRPLSKACHRAIKTPRVVIQPQQQASGSADRDNGYDGPLMYALGWWTGTYRGHRVYTHSGGMEPYGAEIYFFPDLGYGVVTMANTAVTSNYLGEVLAWRLINDRLGVPEAERFDWAGRRKADIAKSLRAPDTAMDDYFPRRAQPPLPRSLSLEEYIGTYFHPAYQKLVITRNTAGCRPGAGDGEIMGGRGRQRRRREFCAAHNDRVWKMDFEFEHVSGEHWLVYIEFAHSPNKLMQQFARAEFKIGPVGKVEGVNIEYLEDGSEGVIEYRKT